MVGAYIPVTTVPENMVKEVHEAIVKDMDSLEKEKSPKISTTTNLFDSILGHIEEYLAVELFAKFFRSKFYVNYRERATLHDIPLSTKTNYAFSV